MYMCIYIDMLNSLLYFLFSLLLCILFSFLFESHIGNCCLGDCLLFLNKGLQLVCLASSNNIMFDMVHCGFSPTLLSFLSLSLLQNIGRDLVMLPRRGPTSASILRGTCYCLGRPPFSSTTAAIVNNNPWLFFYLYCSLMWYQGLGSFWFGSIPKIYYALSDWKV